MKKVVLIGASGFVGSAILNEALNRDFHVTAVVRNPDKIKIENEHLVVRKQMFLLSMRFMESVREPML